MNSRTLFTFALAKSGFYALEGLVIPLSQAIASRSFPRLPLFENPKLFLTARRLLNDLLWKDAQRIAAGFYPSSVLLPQRPVEEARAHLSRLPGIFRDAVEFQKRKKAKTTKKFSSHAKANAKGAPDYYVRNFHFQEDGYLSEKSAAIYDHQVELLFGGAGDAMRRLAIAPIKNHFTQKSKLKILELGCGTGSSTRFLALAFPEAEIQAIDLSKPYLEEAKLRPECAGVKFTRGNAEKLPFPEKSFDAVVSVFLFHELPMGARQKILAESMRVLKKGGLFTMVDSLQLNDERAVNEPLRQFPREFHEPFYPNYIRNPMERLLTEAGFRNTYREIGFFSKVCAAIPIA